ncbi:MAG: hypothetical protein VB094_05050 [Oscillibacter sp.]|nr:hypothetical protein [Oscillibacter sp.]
MTSKEKDALKQVSAYIKRLAGMEKASFSMSEEKDKSIKSEVRPYMMWFECAANHIDSLAEAQDKYDTQNAIDDIFRYCN